LPIWRFAFQIGNRQLKIGNDIDLKDEGFSDFEIRISKFEFSRTCKLFRLVSF